MGRKRIPALVCAVLSAAMALGCLEFDEQTVYIEHDEANDRIILLIRYLGLYAGRGTDPFRSRVDEAAGDLAQALEKRQVAVFATWPASFDLNEYAERVAVAKELPEDLATGLSRQLEHVRILNAGFCMDLHGRLSGVQVVVIERFSEFLTGANEWHNAAWLLDAEEEAAAANPNQELAREWARLGHQWFRCDGHRLTFSAPGVGVDLEADLAQARCGFTQWLESRCVGDPEAALQAFLDGPIRAWKEGDEILVSIGDPSEPSTFVTRPPQGDYRPNLVEHVRRTYGLHFHENVARYIVVPTAPALTEAEEAAKIIAPRLGPEERALALLRVLETEASPACYDALRREGREIDPQDPSADLPDWAMAHYWWTRLGITGREGSGR